MFEKEGWKLGAKAPDLEDRRVQRTRALLRDALIALILERGWESASIQAICERANVGRSTFYTHFADKEELIGGSLENLKKNVRAQLAHASSGDQPLRFAGPIIEHAHENQRLFRAVFGRHGGHIILRRFRDLVVDLVREDLIRLQPTIFEKKEKEKMEAAIHFVAGAFLEMLTWSLDARSSVKAADLEDAFLRMALSALGIDE